VTKYICNQVIIGRLIESSSHAATLTLPFVIFLNKPKRSAFFDFADKNAVTNDVL